jgi:uncharacterized protein YqiB (DUF1249 family)
MAVGMLEDPKSPNALRHDAALREYNKSRDIARGQTNFSVPETPVHRPQHELTEMERLALTAKIREVRE